LTFESDELEMSGSVAMNVAPTAAATQPGTATAAASGLDVMPAALFVLAAVVALAIASLLVRNGRASTDTRVPVRN
jgi:hypothetical protein